MSRPVLIAGVDLGPQTGRVLYHAAGFARLLDLRLKIVHVSSDTSLAAHENVWSSCLRALPYPIDLGPDDVVIRTGHVSDAIVREAVREQAALIVVGARGHSAVKKLILGSSSDAVLRRANSPVLLVPMDGPDIVSVAERVVLTSGPVMAAVDLDEHCDQQLHLASVLAHIAGQPLKLMTVAKSRVTDHQASLELRRRAHELEPQRPTSLIVRRGTVPEEIARCASTEGAGLVVMGLRAGPKCQPGTIASAVLKGHQAFVLAVPGC